MKAYVLTSGLVFALIVAVHVARVAIEGAHLLREPAFAATSLLSLALAIWAWRTFRRRSG